MAQPILMPALSPTMTEGNVAKWLVKEGDEVKSGQVIAEIETDKATMEVEAVDEGEIAKILTKEGTQNVAVNSLIAILAEEGESKEEAIKAIENSQSSQTLNKPETASINNEVSKPASASLATLPSTTKLGRIIASPLAKRLAGENQLDLSKIEGSGPHGRIVKRDIEQAMQDGSAGMEVAKAASLPSVNLVPNVSGDAEFELQPLNSMRKTIAKRLVEAKQNVPHFYLSRDMMLDNLLAARKMLNGQASSVDGKPVYKLSVNDFIIKAAAQALMKVPHANAAYSDEGIKLFKRADISVAVAIDGGLITPVIRAANHKGLVAISAEMKDLAAKARAGKLMPEDYQGGSFTISNLGMFGIEQFQAIINPPQACILAVGTGVEKPVVVDGQITIRNMVTLTLSVDHRAVDGALGAQYLDALKTYIENPVAMLA